MDYSALFRLNQNDLIKGVYLAVIVAFLGALQNAVQGHGLDFASYDWGAILDFAWKAGGAYLVKNFASNGDGMPLGFKKKA